MQVCSAGHELSNTIKVKWKKPEKSREKSQKYFFVDFDDFFGIF